jgi:hypothetical protein
MTRPPALDVARAPEGDVYLDINIDRRKLTNFVRASSSAVREQGRKRPFNILTCELAMPKNVEFSAPVVTFWLKPQG